MRRHAALVELKQRYPLPRATAPLHQCNVRFGKESGPAAIERSGQIADISQMPTSQHTIVNKQDGPIYISIEPWPECYELEPGDRLTLSYGLPQSGDALEVQFINERELVLWPTELDPEPVVLINDASAEGRSWKFKHQ